MSLVKLFRDAFSNCIIVWLCMCLLCTLLRFSSLAWRTAQHWLTPNDTARLNKWKQNSKHFKTGVGGCYNWKYEMVNKMQRWRLGSMALVLALRVQCVVIRPHTDLTRTRSNQECSRRYLTGSTTREMRHRVCVSVCVVHMCVRERKTSEP